MDLGLDGKRAFVMGGSSGLGRGISEALIAEGVCTAICARGRDRLEATALEIGAHLSLVCDLTQPGAARTAVEQAQSAFGGLDILVTNTGGPPKGKFEDITREAWLGGFQTLWLAAVEGIQAALPGMKAQRWGRILLITSTAAKDPIAGLTVSNGLRAGLLGLVNSFSREIAADGITVNALLPGYTRTARLAELKVDETTMTAQIPAGRLGKPEELGALAAFLASESAAYITGQAIACDGGLIASI